MNFKKQIMVAGVLASLACSSYAQFGGGGGGMGGGMGGMRRGGGAGQAERPMESAGRVPLSMEQLNSKLYDLRMRLLITPEQSPTWEGFRQRFIDLATAKPPAVSGVESQSALQTMQRQLSVAQDRFTLMESLYEAHRVLFAALSPQQQLAADQTVPPLLAEIGPGVSGPSASRFNSK